MTSFPRGASEGSLIPGTRILTDVSSVLGSIFSVELGVPTSVLNEPEKNGKKFCVGLLENHVDHAWWPAVRGLGVRERCSISGSLFLARKVLPSPPDPAQAEKHARLMGSPAPHPPDGYLEFVDREIDKLFVDRWDRGYTSRVYSHTPTSSSCLQSSRKNGGFKAWAHRQGPDWFRDVCLGESSLPSGNRVRYTVVRTAGKNRGVTVADGHHHILGPLHRTLYDYLSQFGWLLRGEARGKKFRSFAQRKGEVFVSGDYESATDNLSLAVTVRILSRILSHARDIPASVRDFALRSLIAEIEYRDLGGRVVHQQRGQLMGNFLSFPLLCLHNYLAFRWSVPRDVPLRINGDDIVFRCRPEELERWRENVGAAGLTLSSGKTMVDGRLFSLNSAFFEAQSCGAREIPIVRSSWLEHRDGPPTGQDFSRFVRNWTNRSRRLVGGLWLKSHKSRIQKTGRSVEKLGIRADNGQLNTAGLAPREAFFRGRYGLIPTLDSPLPSVRPDRKGRPCDEWVYCRQPIFSKPYERFVWDRQYGDACAAEAWYPPCARAPLFWDQWWREASHTGFESAWLSWRRTVKRVRKMRCYLNLFLRPPDERPLSKGQWVPKHELPARVCPFLGVGFR